MRTYRVPPRVSTLAIFVLTTILALLFGVLSYFGAPDVAYLFLGTQVVVVCIAQMMCGLPRGVSALAGAIILPVWFFLLLGNSDWSFLYVGWRDLVASQINDVLGGPIGASGPPAAAQSNGLVTTVPLALACIVLGGTLGYCTGAVAASFFMFWGMFEEMLLRRMHGSSPAHDA